MTLDFIPRQSRLVFKLNRVTLVVFDIENTIIMICYAIYRYSKGYLTWEVQLEII